MFAELLPRVTKLVATQSVHPRAIAPAELVNLAHQFGCPAQIAMPVETAVRTALELAGKESAVVITGSLFIAAAAREILFSISDELQINGNNSKLNNLV